MDEVFEEVEHKRSDYGVVPIENSTGGVVPETLDCFIDSDLAITNELYVPVHLFLMAQCPLEAVTTLYSHPQPLAQSRNWLRQHLPQVRVEKATSTVAAAQAAARLRLKTRSRRQPKAG